MIGKKSYIDKIITYYTIRLFNENNELAMKCKNKLRDYCMLLN